LVISVSSTKGDYFMKTIKILLAVLLAVFLTVVTASAQDVAPAEPGDPFALQDPFAPPPPPPPPPPGKGGGGGSYNPGGGGYYNPGGDAGGYYRVPEPSTLALLGIGLVAGLGYKLLKKKRG
jgi:hypothetical protein